MSRRKWGVLAIWQIRERPNLKRKGRQGFRSNSVGAFEVGRDDMAAALQRHMNEGKKLGFSIFFLCSSSHPGRSYSNNCRSVCIKSQSWLWLCDSLLLLFPFKGLHWDKIQDARWTPQWNRAAGLGVCCGLRPNYLKKECSTEFRWVCQNSLLGFLCQILANNTVLFTSFFHNSLWVHLSQEPMRRDGCDPSTLQVGIPGIPGHYNIKLFQNPSIFF